MQVRRCLMLFLNCYVSNLSGYALKTGKRRYDVCAENNEKSEIREWRMHTEGAENKFLHTLPSVQFRVVRIWIRA